MGSFAVNILFLVILLTGCQQVSDNPEARIERLGRSLRCPICRGVSIAESPSAVADAMMQLLREQVKEGRSDAEVLKYFEERYGEWILLEPKPKGVNWGIWLLPGLFLAGGGLFILRRVRSSQLSGEISRYSD